MRETPDNRSEDDTDRGEELHAQVMTLLACIKDLLDDLQDTRIT